MQHHTAAAAPQSSTPIKGSHMLEVIGLRPSLKEKKGSGSLSESLGGETCDNVDGGRADTSVEESVDVESGQTSIDESMGEEEEDSCVEDKVEEESTTQNRKSFCSLM